MANLKTLASERKYAGKVFSLVVDEIEYPSGNKGIREVAEHPGGAVVVPMLDDGRIVLIRQFRYPIHQVIYELPAGKLELNENPADCAARELEEETGYSAESIEPLSFIFTTPGFCTEKLHLYLARGLRPLPSGTRREEGELDMTVELIPFAQAVAMIERGEIVDGKTIAGIFLASRKLQHD